MGLCHGESRFPHGTLDGVALRCVWLFLSLAFSHASTVPDSFSIEVPKTPVLGLFNGSMSLPCTVSDNMDVRQMEVRWYRASNYDTPVLLYKNGQIMEDTVDKQYQGRASLLGGLEKGDVSLKLDHLTVADDGSYTCQVKSERWYDKKDMTIGIQAVGATPILSVADAEGGHMNVSCHSRGWLPKPSLIWRDGEEKVLNHLSKDKFTTDSEGFFSVSSWLLYTPSDSGWLSCSVALSASNQDVRESRVLPHTPADLICSKKKKEEDTERAGETQQLNPTEWDQVKEFKEDLTIDPEETPRFFRVTHGGKRVTCTQPKEDPEAETQKIFTLCREKFSSGKHYWEVKIREKTQEKKSWYVGVASENAERVFRIPLTPANGLWVLCYEEEHGVHVRDVPVPLPHISDELTTVGVFLDCDEHTLSFYNADTKSHLHTLTNLTLIPLRPLISPGYRME
ncbi:hypothetical protein NFI96_003826 [Prochilodus magdalenae]|nr:hypothetical protein NFI96_003826 [Prochilodus magdalenae]